MIKSRYKIEYVIPDIVESKSNKLRFLAYLLLIPAIVSVVGAITYGFVLKDLSTDTVALFQKAKIEVLNLNSDQREPSKQNNTSTVNETTQIIEETISGVSKDAKNQIDLPEDVVFESDKVEELLLKNKKYVETSEKQLATNAALTENLNILSEQLEIERNKNETLNQQLSNQEADKKKLTELLNVAVEKSKTKQIKDVVSSKNIDEDNAQTNVEKTKTDINSEKSVDLSIDENAEKEVPQNITHLTIEEPTNSNTESTSKTSEVDAIMAAMKGIETSPKNNSEGLQSKIDN